MEPWVPNVGEEDKASKELNEMRSAVYLCDYSDDENEQEERREKVIRVWMMMASATATSMMIK